MKAPGIAIAPISSATAISRGPTAPAKPNTATLVMPMPMEMTASVAITAAPCRPAAISIESSMTPAPVVPPATTPQPAALSTRPRSLSAKPRRLSKRRSGTLSDHHGADHERRAAPGELRVAPGAEHGERQRRRQHDQRAAPVDQMAVDRRPGSHC